MAANTPHLRERPLVVGDRCSRVCVACRSRALQHHSPVPRSMWQVGRPETLQPRPFSPHSALCRVWTDLEGRPARRLNIPSPVNHSRRSSASQNTMSFVQQRHRIVYVQNIEEHDEAHRFVGSSATLDYEVTLLHQHIAECGMRNPLRRRPHHQRVDIQCVKCTRHPGCCCDGEAAVAAAKLDGIAAQHAPSECLENAVGLKKPLPHFEGRHFTFSPFSHQIVALSGTDHAPVSWLVRAPICSCVGLPTTPLVTIPPCPRLRLHMQVVLAAIRYLRSAGRRSLKRAIRSARGGAARTFIG